MLTTSSCRSLKQTQTRQRDYKIANNWKDFGHAAVSNQFSPVVTVVLVPAKQQSESSKIFKCKYIQYSKDKA